MLYRCESWSKCDRPCRRADPHESSLCVGFYCERDGSYRIKCVPVEPERDLFYAQRVGILEAENKKARDDDWFLVGIRDNGQLYVCYDRGTREKAATMARFFTLGPDVHICMFRWSDGLKA